MVIVINPIKRKVMHSSNTTKLAICDWQSNYLRVAQKFPVVKSGFDFF
jgi:hypothetical protein